jgi:uncharacterized repeat protein (TIGR04138 family)
MQKLDFNEAVELLAERDLRYHSDAYFFLRDALDHAVKLRKRQIGEIGHVTGQQICEAARQLALKQFGPMVPTVFAWWGLERTEDFGEMVWSLIELGVVSKTETDTKADYSLTYDFHTAFVVPYLPKPGVGGQNTSRDSRPAKSDEKLRAKN